MRITRIVNDYLLQLNQKPENSSVISVDKSGTIQYCHFPDGSPFISNPTHGVSIEDFFPGAMDILHSSKNIYLPNLQTLPDKYYDIHVVTDKNLSWLIFIDVTEKALAEQGKIEAYNIERLENSITKYPVSDVALLQMEVLLLKHETENKFKIISKIPAWFKQIQNQSISDKTFLINEVFPFLEYYFQQYLAENNSTNKKLNSGYWLQQINNHKSVYMQAFGFRFLAIDYLLIYPSDFTEENKRQELIQKARENVLAYEKLEKQDKQLKTLLKFKEKFAAVVSHDFRTPLVGLSDSIKMLLEDHSFTSNIKSEHIELLNIMSDELDLLSDYNNKIYNWSKLENENFDLDIQQINIETLFKELKRKFKYKTASKQLEIVIDVQEKPELSGDYLLLNQALSNLLENSIKFSNPHNQIWLRSTNHSIIVKDNGIGMNENIRNSIFGNLQNDSRPGTHGEKGTGLGMNIVKTIVASHGFKIGVKSEVNKGTEFEIHFS